MPKIVLSAKIENIEKAVDFVNGVLENAGCSMRDQIQIDVAVDELMSNVAQYAYANGKGDITISIEILDDPRRAVIVLTDEGMPYDPLKKEDPDITLSAEKRKIGGLGIFIVKQTADRMTYEHKDNKNIVTIEKRLG